MSGLDKMKAQIIAEAQDNAKEILAQAHAQADSIIGEAKVQAEKDARKIIAQAEARAEDSVKRLASSSDMRKRKAVLEAKQEVIREVLEDAYKAVGELDDAAYFAMLEKVLEKYVLPEAGTICFTEKDRKRMPQGYMEKVYETAKKKGGSLELTETVPDGMDGGFILTYGGIALGRFPRLVIDRTGIALVGAIAMVLSGVLALEDAFASIHVGTLLLLYGLMIVSVRASLASR